jgi:hypothetical protein
MWCYPGAKYGSLRRLAFAGLLVFIVCYLKKRYSSAKNPSGHQLPYMYPNHSNQFITKNQNMKSKKILFAAIAITGIAIGGLVYAADHRDTVALMNQPTDITDVYVFRGQDQNNLVFVANTQGLLTPAASATAQFDANTLLEFNIDNNNDNVEDLVIQAIVDGGKMKIYGPIAPSETGKRSKIEGAATLEVGITPYGGGAPIIATSNSGIKAFAGPRDDPFFFDLDQFKKIIATTATGFNDPGTDTFKGTNVMSVVVEVPKSMLNASTGKVNVWLETKKKI